MRILHFLWGLNQGGAENLAVDLANAQSRSHEVVLMVGNDGVDAAVRERLDPAVRFVFIGRPAGSRNPLWIARLLWAIHRLRPDIIHSHTRDLASLGRFIRPPMVLTVHSVKLDLAGVAPHYGAICCISDTVLADVRARCPDANPLRVDNGVVVDRIATAAPREARAVLRGVQVSRLAHETKGQDLLLRALAAVNAGRASPQLTMDFIGDGASLDFLRELAETLGVSGHCRFLGALGREAVYARLCDYDLLVQPSRYEGFGLTVAEGMAAGVPVLVSDIEGPMEIIGHGAFGSFFKCGDADALTAALATACEEIRSGTALQRAAAARRHVADTYGLQKTSDRYCDIYRDVVSAGGGAR